MKVDGLLFLGFVIVLAVIPGAFGVSVEGGTSIEVGGPGSAQGYSTADDSGAISEMRSDGIIKLFESAQLINTRTKNLEETSQATDFTGKHAETYVKVVNGQGITYSSKILPKGVSQRKTVSDVSAEEWLTVSQAASIECKALASYSDSVEGSLSANVGIKLPNGGSLNGYNNKASASATKVETLQKMLSASGPDILVTGNAIKEGESYTLDTVLAGSASLIGTTRASAGSGATIHGTEQDFISAIGDSVTITDSRVKDGSTQQVSLQSTDGFSGIVTARDSGSIIQDMVNVAADQDTINVAAGTYEEAVNIDKDLTLKGTSDPTADSFSLTNGAWLGPGSGGISAPVVTVNQGSKIQDGITLASNGGDVNVNSGTYSDNLDQIFYVNNIRLVGYGDPVTSSISLDRPVGTQIRGITANTVNVLNTNAKIQDGVTLASSEGTVNVAAGTYLEDVNINKDLTLKGTSNPTATSFALNAILGTGSCGIFAPTVTVNPYSKILDGILLSSKNVYVNGATGYIYGDDLTQNFYAKDITLTGFNNPVTNSFTLNRPVAGKISGITANTVNVLNTNAKIQEGIDLVAQSGTINVEGVTFYEDVNINKDLTLKGAGATTNKFSLTDGAILGDGSGGITAQTVTVNPYSKITDGLLLSSQDVHVYGDGGTYTYSDQLDQSVFGSSIVLTGYNNALTDSISINQDVNGKISGITANTVNVLNSNAKIQDGVTLASRGGTVNVAPGIYGEYVLINKPLNMVGVDSGATAHKFTLNDGASILSNSHGLNAPIVDVNNGAKIQDGVTLASSGGTVNVAAGEYNENIVLAKPLTLAGVGRGDDSSSNTIIVAAQKDQPIIDITTGNVVIKDLQVMGANEFISGQNPRIGSGIRISGQGNIDSVTLENIASKSNYDGIYIQPARGKKISNVVADGIVISDSKYNGVEIYESGGGIPGVNLAEVSGLNLNNAKISNSGGSGVHAYISQSSLSDLNLSNAEISNSGLYGVRISGYYSAISKLKLDYAQISGSGVDGVRINNYAGAISAVTLDNAQITNSRAYGVYAWTGSGSSTTGLSLNYAKILRSGYDGVIVDSQVGSTLDMNLNNAEIAESVRHGVNLNINGNSNVQMIGGNIVQNGGYGLLTTGSGNSNIVINNVNIHDNLGGGVANFGAMIGTPNATYNWWGSTNGPSGEGSGSGDSVSTNVEFNPWSTTEYA